MSRVGAKAMRKRRAQSAPAVYYLADAPHIRGASMAEVVRKYEDESEARADAAARRVVAPDVETFEEHNARRELRAAIVLTAAAGAAFALACVASWIGGAW